MQANLSERHQSPTTFGLIKLTLAYTREKMAKTLAVRDQRRAADPAAFDVGARAKVLVRNTAADLRGMMKVEFFGDGWDALYAPRNMSVAAQSLAVEQARRSAEFEEGKRWAWEVRPRRRARRARSTR